MNEVVVKKSTIIKLVAGKLDWMDVQVKDISINGEGDFVIKTDKKVRQRAKCKKKIKKVNIGLGEYLKENWILIPGYKQGFHISKLLILVKRKYPTITKKYLKTYINRNDKDFPFYYDKEIKKVFPTYSYLMSCSI